VAAIIAHKEQFAGKRVATVLCGSSITTILFEEYLS
jgi:hypothetical protein